ncbi:PilN domain-containing protein [Motilimonas pumila]|uniref:MSHA biogenesis protein MshI n=1 Tax=Motilimonas pumila TaxID=2303987 RepID=A0A418YHV8_9GAMM|nr:PilN domain-containing protein [Motilimonas pumila]RJG49970.1 hypothetical protein D1Z90_04815 [Motilimonas pumila]
MKTRVNLYTQDFVKKKEVLSLLQMVYVWAALLVLTVLGYSYYQWQLTSARAEQQASANQLQRQQAELEQLNQRVSEHLPSKRLQQELTYKKAELAAKQKLLGAVLGREQLKNNGFAAVLTDLAKLNDKDIRLTQFAIEQGNVSLSGIAYANDAVPRWVKSFKQSETLAGQEFSLLKVSRDENEELSFQLIANTVKEAKQ